MSERNLEFKVDKFNAENICTLTTSVYEKWNYSKNILEYTRNCKQWYKT
jgi:hypothetical protein